MDNLTSIATKGHVFWVLFALTGTLFILRGPFSEILLGAVVVFLGIHKLASDLEARQEKGEKQALVQTLREIREWMEQERSYVKRLEARYENRFFQDNKKRIETGRQIEKLYRDYEKATEKGRKNIEKLLEKNNRVIEKYVEKTQRGLVRKVLDMDNKIADMTRIFLKRQPRSGRGK